MEKFRGRAKRVGETGLSITRINGRYGEESKRIYPELSVDEESAKANRDRQSRSGSEKKIKAKAKISLGGNFGKNK